ncbi:class I SAM-dependent methyltransferase [Microvirga aerophila]|uniref:class I SAM-dependent methyltransferase n=1 Tax=Microvirga aerophila TaxID=670291 RepID=UPI001FE12EB1|nr:class I SAM-dependent methyltransferase [Microvirga aerophila]
MSGFDPQFFDILVKYEETSFWFVNRAALITALLARYFPHAAELLEIGCGTGSVLMAIRKAMPRVNLTGSELHPSGLIYARERLADGATLLQMDARDIIARSQFDVIGAFDVLEHIAEDEAVMRQMHVALKPSGGVIVSVPQHRWLWSPADDVAFHERRYPRGEMERKLEAAGFRILHSTSFNSLLLPLMIASRQMMILRERRGIKRDALSEFQMSGWLNRVLSSVLRIEVGLTKAGIHWPVGGSRVVVAQKA